LLIAFGSPYHSPYGLAAIQAAKMKQIVMTPEKISGTIKKYFQLKNVTIAKHAARPQVTIGIANTDSLGNAIEQRGFHTRI
jgi:hypothetical protein